MNLLQLKTGDRRIRYPAFYNAYPVFNEISAACSQVSETGMTTGDFCVDTLYGRIFTSASNSIGAKYGRTEALQPYVVLPNFRIVDELRVPYRRIPIYAVNSIRQIRDAYELLQSKEKGHAVLLRGQTKIYRIDRPPEESVALFGSASVQEPSFLPSHLRKNFDPLFLNCMWQSQAAILLNDIGVGYARWASSTNAEAYFSDVRRLRSSHLMSLFSLGLAQHYGLPSVGLDLTSSSTVAAWFASHTISVRAGGEALLKRVAGSEARESTVFCLRCPRNAVFEYKSTRPRIFPIARPDTQSAWFGHVGWGLASNQLASYLMCGFRLEPSAIDAIDKRLDDRLFPAASEDLVLEHFLKMRAMGKYEGCAKAALQGVYFTRL